MDIEELKLIVDLIDGLGEKGLTAFIIYIASDLTHTLIKVVGVAWIFVAAIKRTAVLVARYNDMD